MARFPCNLVAPCIETARQNAVFEAQRRIAADRSNFLVFADAAASGATFGQSSRLANYLAGEDAEYFRSLSIAESPYAHFGGRAASLIALGMLPIPGLGKWAVGAQKGLKAGTLFEAGGKTAAPPPVCNRC